MQLRKLVTLLCGIAVTLVSAAPSSVDSSDHVTRQADGADTLQASAREPGDSAGAGSIWGPIIATRVNFLGGVARFDLPGFDSDYFYQGKVPGYRNCPRASILVQLKAGSGVTWEAGMRYFRYAGTFTHESPVNYGNNWQWIAVSNVMYNVGIGYEWERRRWRFSGGIAVLADLIAIRQKGPMLAGPGQYFGVGIAGDAFLQCALAINQRFSIPLRAGYTIGQSTRLYELFGGVLSDSHSGTHAWYDETKSAYRRAGLLGGYLETGITCAVRGKKQANRIGRRGE